MKRRTAAPTLRPPLPPEATSQKCQQRIQLAAEPWRCHPGARDGLSLAPPRSDPPRHETRIALTKPAGKIEPFPPAGAVEEAHARRRYNSLLLRTADQPVCIANADDAGPVYAGRAALGAGICRR